MRKLKILFLCLFTIMLTVIFMPEVFASPCCSVEVQDISQSDGKITVTYAVYSEIENREINLKVSPKDYWETVYETTLYATPGVYEYSFSFDTPELVEGEIYELELDFAEFCPLGYCNTPSRMTFVAKEGMPTFNIEDLPDGVLSTVGPSKVCLKVTAPSSGLYKLFAFQDWQELNINEYPNEYITVGFSDFIYFNAGETKKYIVSGQNGEDLSAEVTFEAAKIYSTEAITADPNDNDLCFSISENIGLNSVEITKAGVYRIDLTGEYVYFQVLESDGRYISSSSSNNHEVLLSPGTYYIDTSNLNEDYLMTVTYTVPETIQFGLTYSAEPYKDKYYIIEAEQPAALTLSGDNIFGIVYVNDSTDDFYDENMTVAVASGKHYVNIYCWGEESEEFSLIKEPFTGIPLDTAVTPDTYIGYDYYFAFCAPEDGAYEFDFTKCEDYYSFDCINESYYADYYTMEIKKGQWVLCRISSQPEITVRKYSEPEATALTFDSKAYFDYYTGKEYLYSFTPEADGEYKFKSSTAYFNNVKIYTDDEVLYSSDSASYSFNVNLELKKNVTVYISLFGTEKYYTENRQNDIMVTNSYINVEESTVISLDSSNELDARYIAKESGFYTIELSKISEPYYQSANVYVGSKYVWIYDTSSAVVHLSEGQELIINFSPFYGSYCDVTVNINKTDTTAIKSDTEYDIENDVYYAFTPDKYGLYKIDSNYSDSTPFNVIGEKYDGIGWQIGGSTYFVGVAGETYLIKSEYTVDETDNTMLVIAAQTENINCNEQYTSYLEPKFYSLNITEEGLYRINNELSNTELRIFFNGEWQLVSGTYSCLFRLGKGTHYILTIPEALSPYASSPYAKFTVVSADDNAVLSVNIEDGYYIPSNEAIVEFCVTAPYDMSDLTFGAECVDEYGNKITNSNGYESMYCSDKRYSRVYFSDIELGKTYTLKPFVFAAGNEDNKIYGEEKTITFDLKKDIKPIYYNCFTENVKVQTDYDYTYRDFYYEFTQPKNAEDKTYISCMGFSWFNLYDENMTYVNSSYEEGISYYELEGGKKYYLIFSGRNDGEIQIEISSLPEEVAYAVTNAVKTDNGVCFVVTGSGARDTVLYACFYDSSHRLSEVSTVSNPSGELTVYYDDRENAYSCKIILVDKKTFAPVCKNVEIELKKLILDN